MAAAAVAEKQLRLSRRSGGSSYFRSFSSADLANDQQRPLPLGAVSPDLPLPGVGGGQDRPAEKGTWNCFKRRVQGREPAILRETGIPGSFYCKFCS